MKTLWRKFVHLFDPIDLTKGKVGKGILLFLVPIIFSLVFQQIYTLVDSMIVGQCLDEMSVAGVNNATNILFLFLYFAMGCTSGFSVVIGEKIGAKDEAGVRRAVTNQIYLCLIITVLLMVLGVLLIDPLLSFIGIAPSSNPTAQGVYENAHTYMMVIILGVGSQMIYNNIVGTLRSVGDSFTPFMFLLASTLLNIGLDLLFIQVFPWGVAGAAWATVIAQLLAGLGCYVYAFIRYPMLRPHKEDYRLDREIIWASLKNGLPMAFNYSVLAIGIIIMQGAVDRFDVLPDGVSTVSGLPAQMGYGVGCKIVNFLMAPLNGLGMAMLAFHSQNLGAHDRERIKRGFKVSLWYGLALYGIVLVLGMLLTINGAYQYLFLSSDKISDDSIKYGNAYIYTALPCFYFLAVLYICRNTLQGLERPLFAFLAGVGELFARALVCTYLPLAFTGGVATSSTSSIWAFVAVSAGDPMAWLVAMCIMIVPTCIYVYGKKGPERIIRKRGSHRHDKDEKQA